MSDFGWHTTGEEAASALSARIHNRTSKYAVIVTANTDIRSPVLVTGVTPGGLGCETARVIALQGPKLLIIAGRSSAKLAEAEEILKAVAPGVATRQLKLNLGSLSDVRKAAAEVNGWDDVPTIDVVINNAGIMAQPFSLTEDGIESQFGTNHIGHFLFTQLIIDKVLAAGEGKRVVNVSSNAYKGGGVRFEDWNFKARGPDTIHTTK
jgi:NAD(P)-dependent dehydrogenase (short-subunit alcohol dehydrogenase family)